MILFNYINMAIIIPDEKFEQIMTCMGGSFLEEGDLEISDEDIKNTIIVQAIQEYYRWYPIPSDPYTVDIQSDFTVDFPNDSVFSVLDVRQNTSRNKYGTTGNALIDERYIRNSGTYGYAGKYGTNNNYGFMAANIINRFERQSALEMNKTFKWQVNEQTRKLTGFANTLSTISVIWASWSNDWKYIAFSQDRDVIKLSQAYVLRFFGDLRSQEKIDGAPIEFDFQILLDRADKLETEVLEKWKKRSVPIIIRN